VGGWQIEQREAPAILHRAKIATHFRGDVAERHGQVRRMIEEKAGSKKDQRRNQANGER
jgi:hypothetical protein